MMKNKMHKLTCLLLIFSTGFLHAQQFNYKADLEHVKETGFYTIHLQPGITSHLKTDFSDLRIADENNKWIPHILRSGMVMIENKKVTEFPIIHNHIIDSGKTELILKNNADTFVSVIRLFLKNMAVSRTGIISGSNDQQHWFIISSVTIERSYETTAAEYIQELSFNPSDYKFFKIIINNLQNDPVNILRAGVYKKEYVEKPPLIFEHADVSFSVKDSGTATAIFLISASVHHIGNVRLQVTAPSFYARDLSIYLPGNNNHPGTLIGNYEIRKGEWNFEFPVIKTNKLFIVIENKDNPPLTVTSVYTGEPYMYATTFLEAGKNYHLLMESDSATAPDFDLAKFKDSIPANTFLLKTGVVSKLNNNELQQKDKSFFRKWMLWPALLLALFLLFMLVKSLLNDVKKNNHHNSKQQ